MLLRKVDLTESGTEAAAQAKSEYQVSGIPDIRVFDGKGSLVQKIVGADFTAIENAVLKALAQ